MKPPGVVRSGSSSSPPSPSSSSLVPCNKDSSKNGEKTTSGGRNLFKEKIISWRTPPRNPLNRRRRFKRGLFGAKSSPTPPDKEPTKLQHKTINKQWDDSLSDLSRYRLTPSQKAFQESIRKSSSPSHFFPPKSPTIRSLTTSTFSTSPQGSHPPLLDHHVSVKSGKKKKVLPPLVLPDTDIECIDLELAQYRALRKEIDLLLSGGQSSSSLSSLPCLVPTGTTSNLERPIQPLSSSSMEDSLGHNTSASSTKWDLDRGGRVVGRDRCTTPMYSLSSYINTCLDLLSTNYSSSSSSSLTRLSSCSCSSSCSCFSSSSSSPLPLVTPIHFPSYSSTEVEYDPPAFLQHLRPPTVSTRTPSPISLPSSLITGDPPQPLNRSSCSSHSTSPPSPSPLRPAVCFDCPSTPRQSEKKESRINVVSSGKPPAPPLTLSTECSSDACRSVPPVVSIELEPPPAKRLLELSISFLGSSVHSPPSSSNRRWMGVVQQVAHEEQIAHEEQVAHEEEQVVQENVVKVASSEDVVEASRSPACCSPSEESEKATKRYEGKTLPRVLNGGAESSGSLFELLHEQSKSLNRLCSSIQLGGSATAVPKGGSPKKCCSIPSEAATRSNLSNGQPVRPSS